MREETTGAATEPGALTEPGAATEPGATADNEVARVAALREGLPATRAGIYLNTGTCGPLPAETLAAMREVEDRELAVGRATPDHFEDFFARADAARASFAAVLGTDLDAVALTHSTTEGMNLAIGAVDWAPGDRVVTSNLEHPGILGPLAALRDRYGVEIVEADLGDGGDDTRTLDAVRHAFETGAGRTRLLAISHVAWSTGAVFPARALSGLAHEFGALAAIDGAQGAGAVPVDFDAMGADFYAAPGQKWLLGPEGTGALAVGPAARTLVPNVAGFFSSSIPYGTGREHLWASARRFETAGFNKAAIAGIGRSAGWLAMYVGLPWAHARSGRLARLAADRLAATPGVRLVTPRERMGTLVSFGVDGWPIERVAEELQRRVHAIVRTIPRLNAIRLSVGWFTTELELARVLDVVEEIAAHTPESLPARPAIEFL